MEEYIFRLEYSQISPGEFNIGRVGITSNEEDGICGQIRGPGAMNVNVSETEASQGWTFTFEDVYSVGSDWIIWFHH